MVAERLTVVAATANADKLVEMRAVFGDVLDVLPRPAHLAEVVEDAGTFVGNARLKARAVCAATGMAALADDSGLEVDALDGEPGVESAYYGGADHDDAANRRRLLAELRDVADGSRTARFRTVMVLQRPPASGGAEIVAEGVCEGTIGRVERGAGGFGYDPLFIPSEGDGRSFGEHTRAEKNAISHRSRACRALLEALAGEADRPTDR